ncbi:MAG TPA: ribulose-phosphate 3-epimerase [Chitinophagaceae bacterium]|nr:ribulose-phosphate 3-epimerase [Chitinophagaceae bacterium]
MNKPTLLIAPSLLTADFLELGKAVRMINRSEADRFHLDIMDGRFVPNISFGMPVVARIKTLASKPLEVHLMIEEPERYAEAFRKAGADCLIVHYEACIHLHRNLQQIHSLGMKAGVAINPHTPVALLSDIISQADLVTIMSVNPGFGAQQFISHTLEKIGQVSRLIRDTGASVQIEVDGGIDFKNAASVINAGAQVLVTGNTVFSSKDPVAAIRRLRALRN